MASLSVPSTSALTAGGQSKTLSSSRYNKVDVVQADQLRQAIRLNHEISDRISAKGFKQYLSRIVIDSRPPRRYCEVAEWWQQEQADVIAPAVDFIAGLTPSYTGPLNFWRTLPKGSDKTSSIARLLNWLLVYSKVPQRMYAAAADADQARLIRDAMYAEREHNPFIKHKTKILHKVAWGPGGTLEFLASDAASGQGKLPSVMVYDELSHWPNKSLFDALYSARNKRPHCLTFVISNAGIKHSWQWEARELARTSERWHFYEAPVGKHLASWMNAQAIEEDGKLLTPTEFRRLLKNEWLDPGEESGFVTYSEALRCRDAAMQPVKEGKRGVQYYVGCDYGPKRDRTALCVLHREADNSLVVDRLEHWHRPGGLVTVDEVEQWLYRVAKDFNRPQFVIDPYQMEGTIQSLDRDGFRVERFAPRGGAANYEMAANLRTLVVAGRIKWPHCVGPSLPHSPVSLPEADDLESELSQLLLRVTPSGYRFDHKSGKHDDRAVAVGMAALFAVSAKPPAEFAPPTPIAASQFDFKSPPRRTFFGV